MNKENYQFSIDVKTRYNETDQGGRIYHSHYFVWFDIARTELFSSLGINYAELEAAGIFIVIKKIECDYIRPAHFNQLLTIKINHVKLNKVKLEFYYQVLHGKIELAKAYTKLAFIDNKGKLLQIPNKIREKITENIDLT
ncbi:MAG: acyl-CoA thioesterase [Candidatus Margulisiibacteriota bacterium]|nr:MAG: hypothetical protein A2X43_11185 [Candidatus Margulisbacteria bacterium GWD2_39_127]OGI02789.1 MAG: hypothetical protein A2X42_02010 [Candidatus Margulisbacteria bacterium GWF2_38_17]OGI09324.1 MAG: hypothetical protein A2X41_09365 [Candidatus Margulisbacteria bacterium GWE2_39_32]PZM77394.1 MAG: acyl-CoA thioesterase [Candidatus Margulisiibacteriota bacterium]HAR63973.1 4-hydroxybenzoyl-CoA thioesterase [Candidatus Margulisiibacteriota bacterium]